MGTVFLAEQAEPIRRRVALKLIRRGFDTREVIARFEGERQTLALMQHPHIATVHDAGATEDGCPYFVMEYLAGAVPITRYCDQRRLTIRERLGLFLDLCSAIEHAHQKAIIHRDLKPSNVLVGAPDGKPLLKVIDFGIAKAIDVESREQALITRDGAIIGTPGYMSPEQAQGGAAVDTRTDIYSLGALLYELLVGALPIASATLSRGNLLEILVAIREMDPPTPSARLAQEDLSSAAANRKLDLKTLRRELRGDLDWIAMKALAKDPARRYPSVAELATDLRRHLANQPVLARPPTWTYRLRKFSRRHQWQVAAAAAVLLVAAALGAASWGLRFRRASDLIAQGEKAHQTFLQVRGEKQAAHRLWLEKREEYGSWQPPWERHEEMTAWVEFNRLRDVVEDHYDEAVQAYMRAADESPILASRAVEARRALASVYYDRYRESAATGVITVSPKFFRQSIERLDPDAYRKEIAGSGEIALSSEPSGAEVHCFRYEETDGRLFPLPFHPGTGVVGDPFLEVARVAEGHATFRPGDRWRAIERGSGEVLPARTLGELARALSGVAAGERILVHGLRAGKEESTPWTPYPQDRLTEVLVPGRLLDPLAQFGFLFAGYPLDLGPGSLAGFTVTAPLHVPLPRGSYLFLLRKPGFADTRLTVAIPEGGGPIQARLLATDRIPRGFTYLPAGPVEYGDDPEAYLPLSRGAADVPASFLALTEVTFREYLEFLNDPETLERLKDWSPENPLVDPLVDWDQDDELKRLRPPSRRVDLIPWRQRPGQPPDLFVKRADGKPEFQFNPLSGTTIEAPAHSLSALAAIEYARWLTRKHGGRWRFRLPTDLEWEKAARGVDRRVFVWGNYPVYCYANSGLGSYRQAFAIRGNDLADAGAYPADESPYGVLSLAGGVKEFVITPASNAVPRQRGRFCTLRGGDWTATDYRDLHAASRNRRPADSGIFFAGFRLAADAAE